ncbi:MAG: hypothetical protein LBD14_00140 [Puniceicoccales bacterium]|jgi:type II secretory pathway pseudopilin PulG|nr:hypothetical protein [Puniceicoccales bacterium]
MDTQHTTPRAHRNAFTLVEVIAIAATAGLLLALTLGAISSGLKTSRENAIRQNLFTLWVAANEHLLHHQKDEVTYAELTKANPNAAPTPIAGEDYATANNGKITRDTTQLQITYPHRDTQHTVTYTTTPR